MSGMVVTITGPSGSGKSTLERLLVNEGFARLTSHTTRAPREGEVDGVAYHFVSKEEFDEIVAAGRMVESVTFQGNSYGVSAAEFEKAFAAGKPVVVVVEPNGAEQIRKYADDKGWHHLSVFLTNDPVVLVERFLTRDSATPVRIVAQRLVNLFYHELDWINAMDWDMVFEDFSKENEKEVVDFLVRYVADWMFEQEAEMSSA